MNVMEETFSWLFAANTWSSTGEDLVSRSLEHLWYCGLAIVLAAVIAIPAGWFIGHTKKFSGMVIGITGAARALPTLGLITLFGLLVGIGLVAPIIALVILAIPTILAGTYSGISAINPAILDAARAQGLTTGQLIWRVHIPRDCPCRRATLGSYSGHVNGDPGRLCGRRRPGTIHFLGINTQNTGMLLGAQFGSWCSSSSLMRYFATVQHFATPAAFAC